MAQPVRKKIQISFVVPRLSPSGPTTQLLHLLRLLDRRKFLPQLVLLSDERGDRSLFAEVPADVPVQCLELRRYSVRCRHKLRQLLTQLSPSIVHTQGARPDMLVGGLDGWWHHVATLRNNPNDDYPSKYGRLCGRVLAYWHLRALRLAQQPVACSAELASLYSREFGITAQSIRNGVDTDFYRPGEDVPNGRFGFVWVGSLIPRKEPSLMLDAFRKAFPQETFNLSSPYLSMLGGGPLSNHLSSEYAHPGIRLMGSVDNPQTHYQNASWFVSTSRSEGLPNAVLEALACGVPALLSDIPAHREIAEFAGDAIRLVSEQSTDAWAEALQAAASDYRLPARRRAAREAAVRHFSAVATAQQYTRLYEKLLQQGANS